MVNKELGIALPYIIQHLCASSMARYKLMSVPQRFSYLLRQMKTDWQKLSLQEKVESFSIYFSIRFSSYRLNYYIML